MLYIIVATSFKNVEGPYYIALDVYLGVFDRIPDSGLCSQMDDTVGAIFLKNPVDFFLVFKIGFVEGEFFPFL